MQVKTTRFGMLEIPDDKIISFPLGVPGFANMTRWCLLHHGELTSINWLQSAEDADVALLIADPEVLFADYDVQVDARDLAPIGVKPPAPDQEAPPIVLRVVVSVDRASGNLTANLAAPVLINLASQQAMQIPILNSKYSMRHPVPVPAMQQEPAPAVAAIEGKPRALAAVQSR